MNTLTNSTVTLELHKIFQTFMSEGALVDYIGELKRNMILIAENYVRTNQPRFQEQFLEMDEILKQAQQIYNNRTAK
jgi:hypothetical protein